MNEPRHHHHAARGSADSSIVASLVGIIILVMIAVVLSIMVDKRMGSSSQRVAHERTIIENTAELESMRLVHENLLAAASAQADARDIAESLDETMRQLQIAHHRREELGNLKSALEAEIQAIIDARETLRLSYRTRERERAVGETLESLTLIDGRTFTDVRISGVSDAGMQIRHADGVARIAASDLPRPWHDRFLWTEDERLALLSRERRLTAAATAISPPADRPAQPTPPPDVAPISPDDVQAKRRDLQIAREQAIRIRRELNQATLASRGRSSSPPGSLETWQQRIARIQRDLTAARARHHAAYSALAAVSPNDPILRQLPDE